MRQCAQGVCAGCFIDSFGVEGLRNVGAVKYLGPRCLRLYI
jgi:hypothetical protein